MDILKIKYKAGIIHGKQEKEGYYIKVKNGYVELKINQEALLDIPNIIEVSPVEFDNNGKVMK